MSFWEPRYMGTWTLFLLKNFLILGHLTLLNSTQVSTEDALGTCVKSVK